MTDNTNSTPTDNIEAQNAETPLQYAFVGCLVVGIVLMIIGFITVVGTIFKDV